MTGRIGFFISDVLLAWPRALCIHTPLLGKNVGQLVTAYNVFYPQIKQIQTLSIKILTIAPITIEQVKHWSNLLDDLATQTRGMTAEATHEVCLQERAKLQKITTFFRDIFTSSPSLEEEDKDIIGEIAVATTWLNALIDDVSSRSSLLDKGKKRASIEELAARARAVSVNPTPRASFSFEPLEPLTDEEEIFQESPSVEVPTQPIRIYRPQPLYTYEPIQGLFSGLSPSASEETSILIHPEEEFMAQVKQFDQETPLGGFKYIAQCIYNFALYILIGIPRCVLYDLPHAIIRWQKALESFIFSLSKKAPDIIYMKHLLIEVHNLLVHVERLKPVAEGVSLFMTTSEEGEDAGLVTEYKRATQHLHSFVESADKSQITRIFQDLKEMIFKINPALEKALNALDNRPLISVVMGGRKRAKQAPISPTPVGGSVASADTPVDVVKPKNSAQTFFNNMSTAMTQGFSEAAKRASEVAQQASVALTPKKP